MSSLDPQAHLKPEHAIISYMNKDVNPVRSRTRGQAGGLYNSEPAAVYSMHNQSRTTSASATSNGINKLKSARNKRVFVTRLIPNQGLKMLRDKGYEVIVSTKDRVLTKKEIIAELQKGYDAFLPLLTDKIDGDIMQAGLEPVSSKPRTMSEGGEGHSLKIIANYAVGFDNIDLEVAKKRGLLVTNAPCPELTEAVAEHAFALILALAHRIVEADKFARAGKYKGWEPMLLLGTDVHDKTLGIVGLGRIGFAVAQRAVKGFRMKILYNDVKPNSDFEKEFGAKFVSLEELLRQSDFVSLHVPLLPSTKYLINSKTLALMKSSVFLINTSRGQIVEEKALLRALKQKKIAAAGLDVFECEPSIDCDIRDHLALKNFSNVIITPHTASATEETRQAMSRVAATNIIEALEGRTPPNLVRL